MGILEGKRVIVTGGLTGIGKATVLAMVREGAAVVSMSRKLPTSKEAIEVVKAAETLGHGPIYHIKCDVTNREEVFEIFDQAVALMGGLDALVNSAGAATHQSAEELNRKMLIEMIDIHLGGTIWTNQAAFRHLKEKGGSIINYSSHAGIGGVPFEPAYSVAKGAVATWCRYVMREWGPYLIRVNCVFPAVMSELALKAMKSEKYAGTSAAETAKKMYPLGGKMGEPEDAAELNVFLASDKSKYVTNQMIGVDGGLEVASTWSAFPR